MKKTKLTSSADSVFLKQADDGASDETFYNWRKKHAGLMPSEMRRLRPLEEKNPKLKRIVADLSLDKAMLQDALSKSSEACRQTRACR